MFSGLGVGAARIVAFTLNLAAGVAINPTAPPVLGGETSCCLSVCYEETENDDGSVFALTRYSAFLSLTSSVWQLLAS